MNLAAKYDIEAPVGFVFRELTDFPAWEAMATRRGATISRTGSGPGTAWEVSFPYRHKTRNLRLTLEAATPDSHMTLGATSKLVDGGLTFELQSLSANRTRIEVRLTAKPKTLAARIYVQTLRLARKKLEANFARHVAQFAVEMEDRYRNRG